MAQLLSEALGGDFLINSFQAIIAHKHGYPQVAHPHCCVPSGHSAALSSPLSCLPSPLLSSSLLFLSSLFSLAVSGAVVRLRHFL